jgi:hypothetical protein
LYTFFHIKLNNNIPLKTPLNIACFIAVCQPSDILLSPFALPLPTEFPAFQFPTPSSDINCRTGVDERFSFRDIGAIKKLAEYFFRNLVIVPGSIKHQCGPGL